MKYTIEFRRPLYYATISFLILLILTQSIAYAIYNFEKEKENLLVQNKAIYIKNELSSALNHSISATQTLAYLVEKNLIGDDFNIVSKQLLEQNKFIDALQLVEGDTIRKTYPLEGNEVTIDYGVLNDSLHRKEAMEALRRQELYFEGPIDLIQGGRGVVGRLPIFKEDEYWGFSAVIIHLETIIEALSLDSIEFLNNFIVQLVKKDKNGHEISYFFEGVNEYKNGVYSKAFVPMGNWDIYVKLKNPNHLSLALMFSALGLILSCIMAAFIWYLSIQPARLKKLVALKTQKLDILNAHLKSQAEALSESNKELEQFAYVISHDLQEPLRMISRFLSQLEKKYKNELDDKAKQYIHYAKDGAIRMRQIILDLLEFSKTGSIGDKKELLDLNQIIDDVCLQHRKEIRENSIEIKIQDLPKIYNYKTPLIQIFQNLISNAIKYSKFEENSLIEITATESDEHWTFKIQDNGIGIDPEYFEKIFIIFQRLHENDRFGGTGIGLAIVKKTVDRLGGEIWLESEEGKGSNFYFKLSK